MVQHQHCASPDNNHNNMATQAPTQLNTSCGGSYRPPGKTTLLHSDLKSNVWLLAGLTDKMDFFPALFRLLDKMSPLTLLLIRGDDESPKSLLQTADLALTRQGTDPTYFKSPNVPCSPRGKSLRASMTEPVVTLPILIMRIFIECLKDRLRQYSNARMSVERVKYLCSCYWL